MEYPSGGLDGERMKIRSKVRGFKEHASHAEACAPHAFNQGVLLRRVDGSRPVTNLFG